MFQLQIKQMYWCIWLIYMRRDQLWMEDIEMPQMHKYRESKTTWIMIATVHHVTSGLGLRKFQPAWFLLDRMYSLQNPILKYSF